MTDSPAISAELKRRIFDAVQAELIATGVDGFTIAGVARRAAIDAKVILEHWRDRRVLLMDVMLDRTAVAQWSRDTGSVRTDLDAITARASTISRSARERALYRAVLPSNGDVDLAEICSDLWEARFRDGAVTLQRAADRGQLRDGVVPLEAIRMFASALFHDVTFTDRPVRPEYAEQALDIFLNGILRKACCDRPWPDVDQLLRHQVSPDSGAGADQAVEAARRAVVLMRMWADALPDGVTLYEAVRDDSGRVIDLVCRDLNRAACEEVGLTREEALGRKLVELLPNVASSGLLELYAECIETGKPLVLNNYVFRLFDQDRHLDIRATSPARDLITTTWRDVTDQFNAARLEERYRMLMDYSPIPAALAAPDGHLVSVNQSMASWLGYDVPTMLTMRWQDFTAPEFLAQESEIVADILAGRRENYRGLKQYVHADGHRVKAELLLSCIRRPDGTVENLIAQILAVAGSGDSGAQAAQS